MSLAMALHFGGYEFARSAALALFTSTHRGFSHPSAYPMAIGLVTPASLLLLYWYGLILKAKGPRVALYQTTAVAVSVLAAGTGLCQALFATTTTTTNYTTTISFLSKAVVGALFVFQNSYAHLLYTQQWSFLGSVITPLEGTKWFSTIAGVSSLVCTITATLVHTLSSRVGLLGLMLGTCTTLALSMVLADRAYQLSEEHGFDPSPHMTKKSKAKDKEDNNNNNNHPEKEESLLSKTSRMFRTSATLSGLFGEVIAFQSLSTVLNVCFVRLLKDSIPNDTSRVAFTGKFYAIVNGFSGLMQFLVLPLARKYLEPQWVYRFVPLVLMPLLVILAVQPTSTLWLAAVAFLALKSADYSIRNVANEIVYQPLDFDARYLGKEVIGVFANRFGKSGMSLILSGLTIVLPPGWMGTRQLSQLSLVVGSIWLSCSMYLSKQVVTNKEAEATVKRRRQEDEENNETESISATNQDVDKKTQ
jgi:ATP/ADP translocase